MNDTLHHIFDNVNDWLKFAEAKHSGLIAISSGILLAIPAILKQPKKTIWRIIFIIPALFLGAAILISLNSFTPTLKKPRSNSTTAEKGSSYFFEDIGRMDTATFRKTIIIDSYYKITNLDKDLMEQIIINSRITSKKMKSFKCALLYFEIGFILLIVLFLSKYIFQKESLK